MERGTVVHIGTNARGNKFGFVKTGDGRSIYFNQFGGHYWLTTTLVGTRFAATWTELFAAGPPATSDFPKLGNEIYFSLDDRPSDTGPKAWQWCLADLMPTPVDLTPEPAPQFLKLAR